MAEFPALPLWTDAYLGDTTHLTTTQHGAYLLLLITAWRTKTCDLPDDDNLLARYARLSGQQWCRMRPVLVQFWDVKNGRWINNRLNDERDAVRRLRDQRSTAGIASALKRKHRNATNVGTAGNGEGAPRPRVSLSTVRERVPARRNGTRWDAGAVVPQEWIAEAEAKRGELGLPSLDLRIVAESFKNYWIGKSGADATKVDWHATWMNWAIREKTQNGQAGRQSAHDKFFAGAASLIREIEAGAAEGQRDDDDPLPAGRPLLPP